MNLHNHETALYNQNHENYKDHQNHSNHVKHQKTLSPKASNHQTLKSGKTIIKKNHRTHEMHQHQQKSSKNKPTEIRRKTITSKPSNFAKPSKSTQPGKPSELPNHQTDQYSPVKLSIPCSFLGQS